jgi:hypothetical protein
VLAQSYRELSCSRHARVGELDQTMCLLAMGADGRIEHRRARPTDADFKQKKSTVAKHVKGQGGRRSHTEWAVLGKRRPPLVGALSHAVEAERAGLQARMALRSLMKDAVLQWWQLARRALKEVTCSSLHKLYSTLAVN